MHCGNCGKQVVEDSVACASCGFPPRLKKNHCFGCGVEIKPEQILCVNCGYVLEDNVDRSAKGTREPNIGGDKKPVNAAILAILFGSFGIHKFYHGSTGWGVVYLVFCWTYIPMLVGVVEGIIYLMMDAKDFDRKYNTEEQDLWRW